LHFNKQRVVRDVVGCFGVRRNLGAIPTRRYLKQSGEFASLTNLASTVITQPGYRPEECFEGTFVRVKAIRDRKKESNIGLNGFIKLDLMHRIFGDNRSDSFQACPLIQK
jgi:NRPS condensation-like uncharacterized protein